MTREETYFINNLSDHLNGKTTEPVYDLDWNKIFKLSINHQVTGIISAQCKNLIPDEVKPLFQRAQAKAYYYYLKRKNIQKELDDAFNEKGIEHFTVKGLLISDYYPIPALRTMGDIDLVVHTEDRERADVILREKNFRLTNQSKAEWVYYQNDIEIELHDHLIYEQVINRSCMVKFLSSFWSYVDNDTLDPSYHFLYLLLHIRKHFMNSGIGFRQFMDLAVMAVKEQSLNWIWIHEKLQELDLLKFASTCFGLIKMWFGIMIPNEILLPDEAFFEIATETIMHNGIFGFNNVDNRGNIQVNIIRENRNRYPLLPVASNAISTFFPRYDELRKNRHYRFVDGKPLLTPIAWVYRVGRGLDGVMRGKKKMPIVVPSKKKLTTRDEFLNNWGL